MFTYFLPNEVPMFNKFINYLKDKISLSEEEIQLIHDVAVLKKLRRKQFLLQEGDVWKNNAFVASGLLRTFSVDDKGQEHILNFAPENYWTGDRESLANGTPSRFYIEAIEDAEVVLITKENFDRLCRQIPQLNEFINAVLHRSFLVSQSRIHDNISLSAEEKFQNFLNKFPAIAQRIPQHMIASYLGVTPETLTRIKRKFAKG